MLCRSIAVVVLAVTTACHAVSPKPGPSDVAADGRLVLQCVSGYDKARHDDTCKVYHRVFAPDGALISKDLGGLYPHHRGLFLGFNQLQHGAEKWDFWHCRKGETEQLVRMAERPDASTQDLAIDWIDGHGTVLLHERRQYAVQSSMLRSVIDVRITLDAAAGEVTLDGDPQHSGYQFRALQDFAPEGAPKVSYVRPAGATGGKDDIWTDCDWTAGVLPMPQGKITVLHCDAPSNPRPCRYSTRDYGRFGSTFRHVLPPGVPLQLRYRVVVSMGERSAAECAADQAAFAADVAAGR